MKVVSNFKVFEYGLVGTHFRVNFLIILIKYFNKINFNVGIK